MAAVFVLLSALSGCRRAPDTQSVGKSQSSSPVSRTGDSHLVDASLDDSGLEFDLDQADGWLKNVTAESGVAFTYRNGREAGRYAILESLGGGVGLLDYDGDDRLDVFAPGGGQFTAGGDVAGRPAALFAQRGPLRFHDVTQTARLPGCRGYTHGVSSVDVDNDGFADVLVTGYNHLQLLRNQGDGTFVDVTRESGLAGALSARWNTAAGWGDFDGDGDLDLYVARYVNWSPEHDPRCPRRPDRPREICSPIEFQGQADVLYWNDGAGRFAADPKAVATDELGKGLGVLVGDLDDDGDIDVYVANDTTRNFLFENDGRGRFTELGLLRGAALDHAGMENGSMGVGLTDFDADGMPEIGVANYEREMFALYRRSGATFTHATRDSGLAAGGNLSVGWGTAFVDLDGDGGDELVVANGHVLYHPENTPARQVPAVWHRCGQRYWPLRFPPDHYLGQPHHGRGLAVGDLNNDHAPDLVFSHNNEPLVLLVNCSRPESRRISLRLIAVRGNRDAIGARVSCVWDGHRQARQTRQTGQVVGGCSYLSQNDRLVRFASPDPTATGRVTIEWPSGLRQRFALPHTASGPLVILEPAGQGAEDAPKGISSGPER